MSYLGAVSVALKRFPLLKFPLFVCLIPWALASGISTFGKTVQGYARARIAKGGKVRHLDLLEPIIPPEGSIVSQESKKRSEDWIVAQANSLMAGALGPVTNAIISSILLLCDSPETMKRLQEEVRTTFESYDDITVEACQSACRYLNAVIEEDLRLVTPAPFGLPWYSPGADVDGHFVPSGVCHSCPSVSESKTYCEHRSLYRLATLRQLAALSIISYHESSTRRDSYKKLISGMTDASVTTPSTPSCPFRLAHGGAVVQPLHTRSYALYLPNWHGHLM